MVKGPLKELSVGDCSKIENHTACPDNYLAWHDWARGMVRTHKAYRCPDCGFWAIWVPKAPVSRPRDS